jgi:hypothetical protein
MICIRVRLQGTSFLFTEILFFPPNPCCSFLCALFISSQLNAKQFERERAVNRMSAYIAHFSSPLQAQDASQYHYFPTWTQPSSILWPRDTKKHGAKTFIIDVVVFSCRFVLGKCIKNRSIFAVAKRERLLLSYIEREESIKDLPSAELNTTNGKRMQTRDITPRIYNHDTKQRSMVFL